MAAVNESTEEITKDNYKFLQQHVYRASGIVLDENKQYLLEARLLPLARKENLRSLNDLCALMRATSGGQASQDVVEAMTTNETLFFRDVSPFQAMRNTLVPEFIEERKASRRLNIWSAAASSGQEAYSLAMMLLEMGLENWNVQILGTDLSEKVLERARSGRYGQIEVNRGLPAAMLIKYFTREGLEWRIKDQVKRMCRFQQFDLRQKLHSHEPFDFIFCRNVLIYFDIETKRQIMRGLEAALRPGGYLLLGAAETTMSITDAFERRSIGGASFYKKS